MDTSKTIAIAGCCGYIGTHMTRAALSLGLRVYGIDLMMQQEFLQHPRFTAIETIDEFCNAEADIYYLALQPNHREPYLNHLIPAGRSIFSEKPMARARDPHICDRLVADIAAHQAQVRYNFLLIYNPITDHIIKFLRSHQRVKITYMKALFEKNRESRRNDRNKKFMEPIQYQESIHAVALMLVLRGETIPYDISQFDQVFPGGVIAVGESSPYDAPSPNYDTIPDGRFYGTLTTSGFRMDVMTNFKRFDQKHFPTLPQKKVIITGETDDHPFTIEADYQRDREMLSINNKPVLLPPFQAYEHIWQRILSPMPSDQPHIATNEHLARLTYHISALLWHTSFVRQECMVDASLSLAHIAQSYRSALKAGQLPVYHHSSGREWVEKHLIDPVIDTAEEWRNRLQRQCETRHEQ